MTTLKPSELQTKLTREQKEAVGLLSIGTFLEYFDLMLYVHMAVLLNELFFPKTDPHTTKLLSAFAFCSTYLLRPFGALLFGWIGDNFGRKHTVVITTTMMAVSCIVMANVGTYEQIGIVASWIVTICRITQGLSSMGEVISAELYVTEITKPPVQYFSVAIITIFSSFGGLVALGIASIVTSFNFDWRMAFWIGATIALVGAVARTKLRETPEFVDAKRKLAIANNSDNLEDNALANIQNDSVNIRSSIALFLIQCAWPMCFYFIYFHCGSVLKSSFNFTSEQVIHHNFIISIFQLLSFVIWAYLSVYIHPLFLLKIKTIIFGILILIASYTLHNLSSFNILFTLQISVTMFALSYSSAMPIFYKHFPVFKRFTYASFLYALSRAMTYVITSFGMIYFTDYFGQGGVIFIILPMIFGFWFSVLYFENLEIVTKNLINNKIPVFLKK